MPNYAPFAYPPKVVSVNEVYNSPTNSSEMIPEGFEPTGEFRIPLTGEYYLWCNEESYVSGFHTEPRIILRKVKTYSDGEILDYVLEWINEVIPSYQVSKLSIPSPRRTLVDRDHLELPEAHKGPAALANALKTCVIEKMRKEGK